MLLVERHDPSSFPFVLPEIDDDYLVEQIEGFREIGVGKRKQSDQACLRQQFPQSSNCRDADNYVAQLIYSDDQGVSYWSGKACASRGANHARPGIDLLLDRSL